MFLRNHWYVAAADHEIGQRPLGRMILGEPIVFYRAEDGTPVALEDRCPHRRLPLSMGKLVDGVLQCHYHGLRFDQTALHIERGRMHMPHDGGHVDVTGTIGLATPYPVQAALDFGHMQLPTLLDELDVTPNAIVRDERYPFGVGVRWSPSELVQFRAGAGGFHSAEN